MGKNKNKGLESKVSAPVAKAPTPASEKKEPEIRVMDTRIGLANRKNHDLTVMLKKDSLIIPASGQTGKDYKEKDIVSVQGMPLHQAVAQGMCYIVR